MTHTILTWCFPLYLIIVEMGFRAISGLDTTSFIGPAIATAGLCFLMPLTRPKDVNSILNSDVLAVVTSNGGIVVSKNDLRFVPLVWLLVLFGFIAWLGSCYYSIKYPDERVASLIPTQMAIGAINYIVAAICTSIKQGI